MRVWREKAGGLEEGEIPPEKDNGKFQGTTTFYISNIPDDLSIEMLREDYGRCGQLVDAYIARKRDKFGNVFAFVRFAKVEDTEKMVKALNSVRFTGRKTFAKVARFGKISKLKNNTGQPVPDTGRMSDIRAGIDPKKNYAPSGGNNGLSYRDTLTGEKLVKLEGLQSEPMVSRKGRSVIVEAMNFNSLQRMEKNLSRSNDMRIEIRYLGGLRVMLTFSSPDKAKKFMKEQHRWVDWCKELVGWEGQQLKFERIVWLRILGLPITLRCEDHIVRIGERYGLVIKDADMGIMEPDLTSVYVGVVADHGKTIYEEISISWDDVLTKCWITEAAVSWKPDFAGEVTVIVGEDKDNVVMSQAADDPENHVDAEKSSDTSVQEPDCSSSGEEAQKSHMKENEKANEMHGKEVLAHQESQEANINLDGQKKSLVGLETLRNVTNNQILNTLNGGGDKHSLEINNNNISGEGQLLGGHTHLDGLPDASEMENNNCLGGPSGITSPNKKEIGAHMESQAQQYDYEVNKEPLKRIVVGYTGKVVEQNTSYECSDPKSPHMGKQIFYFKAHTSTAGGSALLKETRKQKVLSVREVKKLGDSKPKTRDNNGGMADSFNLEKIIASASKKTPKRRRKDGQGFDLFENYAKTPVKRARCNVSSLDLQLRIGGSDPPMGDNGDLLYN